MCSQYQQPRLAMLSTDIEISCYYHLSEDEYYTLAGNCSDILVALQ